MKYIRVYLMLCGDEQLEKNNSWDDQYSGEWYLEKQYAEDQLFYRAKCRGPKWRIVPIDVPREIFAKIPLAKTAKSAKAPGKVKAARS